MCVLQRNTDIIKVGRAGELPVSAVVFLSLRVGMVRSSSSWSCENKETAGFLSNVDTWSLIWGSVNLEWSHGIQ